MTEEPKHGGDRRWTYKNWEEFEAGLTKMSPRSKLFQLVRAEIKKRGHWRQKPRSQSDNN